MSYTVRNYLFYSTSLLFFLMFFCVYFSPISGCHNVIPIPPEQALFLFYTHVERPLFVTDDNAVKRSLFIIISIFVTSEQAARNSGTLNHVVVAQNVRHPCS